MAPKRKLQLNTLINLKKSPLVDHLTPRNRITRKKKIHQRIYNLRTFVFLITFILVYRLYVYFFYTILYIRIYRISAEQHVTLANVVCWHFAAGLIRHSCVITQLIGLHDFEPPRFAQFGFRSISDMGKTRNHPSAAGQIWEIANNASHRYLCSIKNRTCFIYLFIYIFFIILIYFK